MPTQNTGRPELDLLKTDEVARMLGYSKAHLYILVRQGEIPCVRLSKRAIRFRPDELAEWVENKNRRVTLRRDATEN